MVNAERSFDFVDFPENSAPQAELVGHDRLLTDRYHGHLTLQLTALTPVFIASGVTALGRDVDQPVPLLKVMGQDAAGNLILQGTSLKGCIRSVYETITNSRLGVKSDRSPQGGNPPFRPVRRGHTLSPAELVFGTMGLQGLVSITDAVGDRPLELGELPPMFQPRAGKGRKFYYHHNGSSSNIATPGREEEKPDRPASPIHQAPVGSVFTTTLRFSNLTFAQLGALLIALGQDKAHQRCFALKVGAGKGKGMGSIAVQLTSHNITEGSNLKASRYLTYKADDDHLSKRALTEALQAAYDSGLVNVNQLDRLYQILQHPEANP